MDTYISDKHENVISRKKIPNIRKFLCGSQVKLFHMADGDDNLCSVERDNTEQDAQYGSQYSTAICNMLLYLYT
jgi:hypothetical protein